MSKAKMVLYLAEAARDNDIDLALSLIKNGAKVNSKDDWYDMVPLIEAAKHGNDAMVEILIQAGANVNIVGSYGTTPLIKAAEYWHSSTVEILIRAGANANAADHYGFTPLLTALDRPVYHTDEHIPTVEILIRAGANVNTANNDGDTPLIIAERRGYNSSTSEILIRAGANVNTANNNGYTPLILAAGYKEDAYIELLIRSGANVNTADNIYGNTPLIMASKNGNSTIIESLIRAGADVNATNKYYDTPLIIASRTGHSTIVESLIRAGANINADNKDGYTALMYARKNGYESIAEMLRTAAKRASDPNATPLNPATNFEGAPPSVFDVALYDELPFTEVYGDADNLIFKMGASYFSLPLSQIRASIADKSGITYACNRERHGAPLLADVDVANPYFLLRGPAIYMIPLKQIKYIIRTPGSRFYELLDSKERKEFTAGYSSVQQAPERNQSGRLVDIVGADHCQAGTQRAVFHLRELRLHKKAGTKRRNRSGNSNSSNHNRKTRRQALSHQNKRRT